MGVQINKRLIYKEVRKLYKSLLMCMNLKRKTLMSRQVAAVKMFSQWNNL